ncbi:alginate export family protein [Silvimonas amylolytica]|uniref:Alginate export family protein n=1 Tax=Silvimonas amylolytica TaxID=449663 RepID=A0ABQ2PGI7_9NEIS|nr:alginate export family protein [Silvimonas amylolytica]GGP24408.1 alginate export family protein [Silvimonas amylolytica]
MKSGPALMVCWVLAGIAHADDATRPVPGSNRWAEDWSVLADPALRTAPLDTLKYLPLTDAGTTYLSLGATLRERWEYNDAAALGTTPAGADGWLIERAQVHADVRVAHDWQVFVQLEDARAWGKENASVVDKNPLDLRLAFVSYAHDTDTGAFKARIGRQDFAFDLQRFVSSRDGPNVRQSFDAVWADWETGSWRLQGFVSQPVQYADDSPFDDTSNSHWRFHTVRLERHVLGQNELSTYYALFQRDGAKYLDAAGAEHRNVYDVRFAGVLGQLDWDLEGMAQNGSVGADNIRAWALGSRLGYTLPAYSYKPRLGLQLDAASGDGHAHDGTLGTFNPLFPNGYYFSLAGYTGEANLLQVKPSFTLAPAQGLSVMLACGFLWRQTTSDAVYTQPNVPVAGTAGHGGRWTGAYGQLRVDYRFDPQLTGAIEAVHYDAGSALTQAGASNGDYVGVEIKYGW